MSKEQIEPVAWWNKSIGGFYLSEKSIPVYDRTTHIIEPLVPLSEVSALQKQVQALQAEVELLKKDGARLEYLYSGSRGMDCEDLLLIELDMIGDIYPYMHDVRAAIDKAMKGKS